MSSPPSNKTRNRPVHNESLKRRGWLTSQLVPTLRTGDVVILDNLSSHKSPGAARALRDIGAWFLFLPLYNPDLIPSKWHSRS